MESDLVYGKLPVIECLRARIRPALKLLLLRGAKGLGEIQKAAAGIPMETCTRADLDKMTHGGVHQGVALEAGPLPVAALAGWLDTAPGKDAIVVLLDGIEDPQNFGAIVRSAAACGAGAVIFAKDRAAPLSPAAVKSAAGGMEYVTLVRTTNLVRAIDTLKESGFWIAGFDADSEQLLWEADLTGRIALVIGSEGKGMRRLVRERCDHQLRIPLEGPITSLNASVSAGIALAECLRQRKI